MSSLSAYISDYERGKLRPHPDMIVRLAKALRVSTDEMFDVKPPSKNGVTVSRRVLRRLTAIDAFLQARRAS